MDNEFDLAIIGGGIIGMCTAWYAAQQYPQWRIAVLEQNKIGSGATQYSASLDLPYGHTQLRRQLAHRSGKLYKALRKEIILPIKDLPFYGIADRKNAEEIVLNFVGKTSIISSAKNKELLNNYSELIIPDGKTIIAGGTASYAMQNEVETILGENFLMQHHCIYENNNISSVSFSQDKFSLFTTTGNNFFAARVVQATGPWLNELFTSTSKSFSFPRVKKIVAFHIMQQPKPDDAVLYFFDDDAFLLPKYEAGYWLFSFKCDHWDVLPDINELYITNADKTKARSILKKYYPSFEPLCNEGRVFCDAYSEDGDPMIKVLDENENYIFAGAGSGSGYRLAPAIAEEAIRLLR